MRIYNLGAGKDSVANNYYVEIAIAGGDYLTAYPFLLKRRFKYRSHAEEYAKRFIAEWKRLHGGLG